MGVGEEESRITGFCLEQLGRWMVLFAELGKRERVGSQITQFLLGSLESEMPV